MEGFVVLGRQRWEKKWTSPNLAPRRRRRPRSTDAKSKQPQLFSCSSYFARFFQSQLRQSQDLVCESDGGRRWKLSILSHPDEVGTDTIGVCLCIHTVQADFVVVVGRGRRDVNNFFPSSFFRLWMENVTTSSSFPRVMDDAHYRQRKEWSRQSESRGCALEEKHSRAIHFKKHTQT